METTELNITQGNLVTTQTSLIHLDRVTHICVSKPTIIGSGYD